MQDFSISVEELIARLQSYAGRRVIFLDPDTGLHMPIILRELPGYKHKDKALAEQPIAITSYY